MERFFELQFLKRKSLHLLKKRLPGFSGSFFFRTRIIFDLDNRSIHLPFCRMVFTSTRYQSHRWLIGSGCCVLFDSTDNTNCFVWNRGLAPIGYHSLCYLGFDTSGGTFSCHIQKIASNDLPGRFLSDPFGNMFHVCRFSIVDAIKK